MEKIYENNNFDQLQKNILYYGSELIEIFSNNVLEKVCFCLAGGCFKPIISKKKSNKPRDIDIFPCSDEDRNILLSYFDNNLMAKFIVETDFNRKYLIKNKHQEEIEIEIVTRTNPYHLREKLALFDIALSCIGIEYHKSNVFDIFIHSDAIVSIDKKEIILITPMPNEPFLLATAERVLRYANELEFPSPKIQIQYLLNKFDLKSDKEKNELFLNYKRTTLSKNFYNQVSSLFGLYNKNELNDKLENQKIFVFQKGEPKVFCRQYLKSEIENLYNHLISKYQNYSFPFPKAILISGFPGAGKSSGLSFYLKQENLHEEYFVNLDDDIIRKFHKQFIWELNFQQKSGYKGLLSWFMESVNYNKTIFQEENSIFQRIVREKKNLIHSGVMDHQGSFDFIEYLVSKQYSIDFIFVFVPVETAIQRAKKRAEITGRWTGKKFILSREKELIKWTKHICKYVSNNKGNWKIYDNTLENSKILESNNNSFEELENFFSSLEYIWIKKNNNF